MVARWNLKIFTLLKTWSELLDTPYLVSHLGMEVTTIRHEHKQCHVLIYETQIEDFIYLNMLMHQVEVLTKIKIN